MKLPVSELLRLACIYAERDQLEYLRCISNDDSEDGLVLITETKKYIEQLQEYRIRRWGKTSLERIMDEGTPVTITEIVAGKQSITKDK